jgi:hypothetical protein
MNSTDGTSLPPDTPADERDVAIPRVHLVALALCVASIFSSAFLPLNNKHVSDTGNRLLGFGPKN